MEQVPDASVLRILLVEDDDDDYLITRRALAGALHNKLQLARADCYDAALTASEGEPYDIYLIDYCLGAHTGADLLAALRAREDMTPAILLIGRDDHDADLLAAAAGATDYLVKGNIDPALLERAIRYARTHAQALHALRVSEAQKRVLIEKCNDAIALIDKDGVVRYVAPSITPLIGFTPDELLGAVFVDFVHPDDQVEIYRVLATILASPGGSATVQYRLRRRDGTWVWIEGTGTNLLDDPNVRAIVGKFRDISERKEAETTLCRQRAYLEALHEVSVGLIGHLDTTELLHAIIQRACELLDTEHGFVDLVSEDGEWLAFVTGHGIFNISGSPRIRRGEGLGGIVWETGRPLLIRDYSAWPGHTVGPHTTLFQAVVGVPLEINTGTIGVLGVAYTEKGRTFDEDAIETLGRFAQLAAIALDNARLYTVAQRELAEHQRAEAQYRGLFAGVQDAIFILDRKGRYVDANPAALTLLGYTRDELLHRSVMDIAAMPQEWIQKELARYLETGEWRGEFDQRHQDGTIIPVEAWATVVSLGMDVAYVVVMRDIRDRRRAEAALRASEQHFRALIERSSDGFALLDAQRAIRYASPSIERILGYTPEEFTEFSLKDLLHPDDWAITAGRIAAGQIAPGETSPLRQARMRHHDGTYRWIEYVGTNLSADPAVGATVVNFRDITERKQIEETLWLHERAVAAATSGILITDAAAPDYPIIFVNGGFERLTGYAAAEVLGRNTRFLQGPETDPAAGVQIGTALAEGQTCQVIIKNYRKDGTPFWNDLSLSPVRDPSGTITHFIGVLEDVTDRVQAHDALRASEQRARAQYEGNPMPTCTWQRADDDWVFVDYNAAADRITRGATRNFMGATARERFHDYPEILADLERCVREQIVVEREIQWQYPFDAAPRDVLNRFVPVGTETITQYVEDITERKQAEQLRRHLATLVEFSTDAIIGMAPDGTIASWNPAAERLYGYSAAEIVGKHKAILQPPDRHDDLPMIITTLQRGERLTEYETRRLHKSGRVLDVSLNVAPIRDARGTIVGASIIARDVSERKQHEARLIHQATHDSLTGLPNRTLFLTRLQTQLDRVAHDPTYHFAVLFLDVDRFKYVNDSMGHLVGDQMLAAVARRLQRSLPEDGLIARLGGDEFAVLLDNIRDSAMAMAAAERLHDSFATPIRLERQEIYCTASIGIVLNTEAYRYPDEMLRDADTAMYEAKRRGRNRQVLFDATMHARVTRFLRLEQELRHALEREEFVLHYQPVVALATGTLLGFEVLVRWNHPAMGLIPPTEFITLAEETGIIGALDRWVLRQACRQLRRWQEQFPAAARLTISVNLSGKDLADREFAEMILATLSETALPASCLNVEITETALIEHAHLAMPLLTAIRAQGAHVYLDDFGTGYSSLTYLRTLPIDAIKIDRIFAQDAMQANGRTILAGIVEIAHDLGLPVIVEGIEDHAQAEHLHMMGCDHGQGYYYARPLRVQEINALLERHTTANPCTMMPANENGAAATTKAAPRHAGI